MGDSEFAGHSFSSLEIEIERPFAWLILSRPEEGNPIDEAMVQSFRKAWCTLDEDEGVRAVAIVARGSKFSVGIPSHSSTSQHNFGPKSCGFWRPVLVELSGDIASGAFQLLGQADVVLAAPGVKLRTLEGLRASVDVKHLSPRLPDQEIVRLALAGSVNPLAADRAAEFGLIDEVVPSSGLRRRSRARLRLLVGIDATP
jgi:enoyl-CoA hydratase/carnithine racemase